MEDEKYKDIVSRLQNLERHVINLIIPLQGLNKFISDDSYREEMLKCLRYLSGNKIQVNEGPFNSMRADIGRLSDKIAEISKMELGQTFAEIKYIGNRLNEIEKILKKIDIEGISKKVELEFKVDGYELVKRPCGYEEEPVETSIDNKIQEILLTLLPRERKAIVYRLGLLGNKACTFEKVGKVLEVTRERARQIYAKALRKLRHPTRIEKVKACESDALKLEVLGDLQ